jgi:hypothetical protein
VLDRLFRRLEGPGQRVENVVPGDPPLQVRYSTISNPKSNPQINGP